MSPAEALAALGDTSDAVAETLRAGGWRGVRNDCGACPTAAYLQAQAGAAWFVDAYCAWGPDYELIALPKPIAHFVRLFDAGHYPDLVAR